MRPSPSALQRRLGGGTVSYLLFFFHDCIHFSLLCAKHIHELNAESFPSPFFWSLFWGGVIFRMSLLLVGSGCHFQIINLFMMPFLYIMYSGYLFLLTIITLLRKSFSAPSFCWSLYVSVILSHSLPRVLSLSRSLALSFFLSFSLSCSDVGGFIRSFSQTHPITRTHTHTNKHTHPHRRFQSLSHTHTHTRTY